MPSAVVSGVGVGLAVQRVSEAVLDSEFSVDGEEQRQAGRLFGVDALVDAG